MCTLSSPCRATVEAEVCSVSALHKRVGFSIARAPVCPTECQLFKAFLAGRLV